MSAADVTARDLARPRTSEARAHLASTLNFKRGIVALVLIIWLIPIKRYTLPANLPFNLEAYRLAIIVLASAAIIGVALGRGSISFARQGKPLAILVGGSLAAQIVNLHQITADGLQKQSLKSLSFFISYLVAYAI